MEYTVTTLKDRWDLFEKQDAVCEEVWPEFMLHDPVGNENWMPFIEAFKEYQLLILEGEEILAVINMVPLHFDRPLDELPDEGWDWGILKSIDDYKKGLKPNMLMGVQIVVNKKNQGMGLSSVGVEEAIETARRAGMDNLIIPVRPSDKHKFPLIPMDQYIRWENGKGYPFDNWLRVHVKAGGKILRPCEKAMRIPGTIAEWAEWTGLEFPGDGSFVVPGALSPISVDRKKDEAVYIEANVWVIHKTK